MSARKRSRNHRSLKLALFLIAVFLFLGGFAYLVWFSDVFTVRAIEVEGAALVKKETISGPIEGNILFWKLPVNIGDYPQIANVDVKKDFVERKVKVSVTERAKVLIWCGAENENCFWADENGFIFTTAPIPEGVLVVNVVRDSTNRELKVGDSVLPADLFPNLKHAIELLNGLDASVEEIRLDDLKFKEATAVIAGGPEVYFSLAIDPRFGKGVLESLMASPNWGAIRYVDLRVENRAYYSL